MHRSSAVCIYPAKLHLTRCRGAPPEASLRAVVLPLGLVPRFCASPRRQSSVFSHSRRASGLATHRDASKPSEASAEPCLGWCLWLRARRLLRLQNLAPHSRHAGPCGCCAVRASRSANPTPSARVHLPSLRSPRIRTERASRPRRACNAPMSWRIIRAGPSRQTLPQPIAQVWFAA